MLEAIAVNVVGVALCLYAYSRPWEWERGPLILLRVAAIVQGAALLCTLAALLLEVPESRGLFAAAAIIALGVTLWRKRGAKGRGPLTSEAAAPSASQVPPRPRAARPPRETTTTHRSVTIREIENMEVI